METEESSIYPPFPSFLKAVKRFCRTQLAADGVKKNLEFIKFKFKNLRTRSLTSTKASDLLLSITVAIMATNQGILRKTVPLSGEQDPICPNSIFLDAEKTTMFGRTSSSETNVRLLSRKTPLMISRKHASIAFGDGKWTIVDHNVSSCLGLGFCFLLCTFRRRLSRSRKPFALGGKLQLKYSEILYIHIVYTPL